MTMVVWLGVMNARVLLNCLDCQEPPEKAICDPEILALTIFFLDS